LRNTQCWGSQALKRLVSGSGTVRLEYFIRLECAPEIETYQPFPTWDITEHAEAKTIGTDAIVTFRDGAKALVVIRRGDGGEDSDGYDGARRQWAAKKDLRYLDIGPEEIRSPVQLLQNCFTIFPWLAEIHKPTDADSRTVLGTVAMRSKPVSIEKLAVASGVDPEIAMAVVCHAYVRGLLQIEEVRTRALDYESRVSSRIL